jgi:hypothetical protein
MFWNSVAGQAVVTDSERAKFFGPQVALGDISPNRKRKRASRDSRCKQANIDVFSREMSQVRNELRGLVRK